MKDQLEILLPVVNKIVDNTLSLSDYTLSIGQCRGLASVIQKTKLPLETLYLENCGVDDDELNVLLNGLVQTNEFSRFIYKNNEFSYRSLVALKPIM